MPKIYKNFKWKFEAQNNRIRRKSWIATDKACCTRCRALNQLRFDISWAPQFNLCYELWPVEARLRN